MSEFYLLNLRATKNKTEWGATVGAEKRSVSSSPDLYGLARHIEKERQQLESPQGGRGPSWQQASEWGLLLGGTLPPPFRKQLANLVTRSPKAELQLALQLEGQGLWLHCLPWELLRLPELPERFQASTSLRIPEPPRQLQKIPEPPPPRTMGRATDLYHDSFRIREKDPEEAKEKLYEAREIFAELGEEDSVAYASIALAELLLQEDPPRARQLLEEGLATIEDAWIHRLKIKHARALLEQLPSSTVPLAS